MMYDSIGITVFKFNNFEIDLQAQIFKPFMKFVIHLVWSYLL